MFNNNAALIDQNPFGAMMLNDAMARGGQLNFGARDAATAGGMAFLVGELEKIDPKLIEPLTAVTWPRDIPVKTGGGWVEYTSMMSVNYGVSDPNDEGIYAGDANAIGTVEVDLGKETYPVFTHLKALKVPLVSMNKMQQIGRSLEDLLTTGLRLNYDKTLDSNAYIGSPRYGYYGLVNNPNVTAGSAGTKAAGGTSWSAATPDEILDDINAAINAAWAESEYDVTGIPNQILVPPSKFEQLLRKNSEAGNISTLEYVLQNNIAKAQGRDITIQPCRWCSNAGVGSTDRMVAYVNDADKVYFDETVPLMRALTQPSVEKAAYLTLYAAQYGPVKFRYYQCVNYTDGI